MEVFSPMVGKVVSVNVQEGDNVKVDDELAVIEAMKMYVKIYSPESGAVKEIKISPGESITTDSVVMVIE